MPESFVQDAAEMGYPPDWDDDEPLKENHIDPASIKEIKTDLSFEELSNAILCDIWTDSFISMDLVSQCYKGNGDIAIYALDGLGTDCEYLHIYYFRCILDGVGESNFSARFLMEVLRETGLPFSYESNDAGWVAWDDQSNVLRVHRFGGTKTIEDLAAIDYAQDNKGLFNIVSKFRITSDHGQKPLLISNDEIKQVREGRRVEFRRPNYIDEDEFDNYMLAYLSDSGSVRTLALSRVARLRIQISTRSCVYKFSRDGICTKFSYPYLLISAFVLAATVRPEFMGCYQILPSGTIFQSGVVTHEIPEIDDTGIFNDRPIGAMVDHIMAYVNTLGDVYLTSGLHPFDGNSKYLIENYSHWVTTPELYKRAVAKIEGKVISEGVKKKYFGFKN